VTIIIATCQTGGAEPKTGSATAPPLLQIITAIAHCDIYIASPRPWTSPTSQNFIVDSRVMMQCLSDSHPTSTFSWRRDGSVVTSSDRLQVDPVTGKLIIYSAAVADAGQWKCVASNERGEGTTVAQLNLIG